MKLPLSVAILLGRHTIEHPNACDIEACAIPMALNAVGISSAGEDVFDRLITPYHTLTDYWPWLCGKQIECPWCHTDIGGGAIMGAAVVFHPFDHHVSNGEITLEQMCDWIRSIEPAEEPGAYQGDAGDETEPKCQVCSEPLYLHNEPCESEDYDPAMVSRERERGL